MILRVWGCRSGPTGPTKFREVYLRHDRSSIKLWCPHWAFRLSTVCSLWMDPAPLLVTRSNINHIRQSIRHTWPLKHPQRHAQAVTPPVTHHPYPRSLAASPGPFHRALTSSLRRWDLVSYPRVVLRARLAQRAAEAPLSGPTGLRAASHTHLAQARAVPHLSYTLSQLLIPRGCRDQLSTRLSPGVDKER